MKNLTTGHPLKLIFFFALPLMFGNLLQQLYIMVDTMIVGRFVGVDALASIGGADWINWAILGLLMGFTQGFSIRVSNCLGANDEKGMEKSIAMSYLSCFVIAILVIIFSQIIIEPLLKLLNTPSHTIQGSITYLRIMSGGALIVIFYNCFSSILRAIGDSRTPVSYTHLDVYKRQHVYKDKSNDQTYMNQLVQNGEDLKIVGIVQPKDDQTATMLSTGIYYPSSLVQHIIEKSSTTQSVQEQIKNKNVNIFTGDAFEEKNSQFDLSSLFTIDQNKMQSALKFNTQALQLDFTNLKQELTNLSLPTLDMNQIINQIQFNVSSEMCIRDSRKR